MSQCYKWGLLFLQIPFTCSSLSRCQDRIKCVKGLYLGKHLWEKKLKMRWGKLGEHFRQQSKEGKQGKGGERKKGAWVKALQTMLSQEVISRLLVSLPPDQQAIGGSLPDPCCVRSQQGCYIHRWYSHSTNAATDFWAQHPGPLAIYAPLHSGLRGTFSFLPWFALPSTHNLL